MLVAVRNAVDELAGAGPLEPLLRAPGVTDVLVNGPEQVWVDRGAGLERTPVRFDDDDAVRRLAVRLTAQAGGGASMTRRRGQPGTTRRHPSARRPGAGVGQRLPASPCASCAGCSLTLDQLAELGTLPGESGALDDPR